MARKSRKNVDTPAIEAAYSPAVYNAAAYVRLSSDDRKKRGDSLETQRNIIENYVAASPDIRIVEVYSDNNATGTNFDRPGFQRMLADAQSGKINCIIVKDLSRFGRNAIDGGYYIEKMLPSIGVRFIAITDSFDSNEPESGIMLPIRQIINESYALDIGRKRRAVQIQQFSEGLRVGRIAPYGYMKSPESYHKLVVNEETAPTVRRIFSWACDGVSVCEIARRLSDAGVQTPAYYNYAKGYDKSDYQLGIPYWKNSVIALMLSDRVYVGDMVQGKRRSVGGKNIVVDPSEWICVPNTHEPIIDREVFDKVQQIRQKACQKARPRKATAHAPSIFAGKVFCARCGLAMKYSPRQKSGIHWFRCESQTKYGKKACTVVSVREADINSAVLDKLRRHSSDVLGKYAACEKESGAASNPYDGIETELRNINRELGDVSRYNRGLYESLVDGLITQEEHAQMKSDYEQKVEALSVRADELRAAKNKLDAEKRKCRKMAGVVETAASGNALTAEMVDSIVEKITVNPDKSFEVSYRFENNGEVA